MTRKRLRMEYSIRRSIMGTRPFRGRGAALLRAAPPPGAAVPWPRPAGVVRLLLRGLAARGRGFHLGEGLLGVGQGLLLARLAAEEDLLAPDRHLGRRPHRAERLAADGADALGLRQPPVLRAELGQSVLAGRGRCSPARGGGGRAAPAAGREQGGRHRQQRERTVHRRHRSPPYRVRNGRVTSGEKRPSPWLSTPPPRPASGP